jgi:hypothetical protein
MSTELIATYRKQIDKYDCLLTQKNRQIKNLKEDNYKLKGEIIELKEKELLNYFEVNKEELDNETLKRVQMKIAGHHQEIYEIIQKYKEEKLNQDPKKQKEINDTKRLNFVEKYKVEIVRKFDINNNIDRWCAHLNLAPLYTKYQCSDTVRELVDKFIKIKQEAIIFRGEE